jgi:protein-tyrosine phosphatase
MPDQPAISVLFVCLGNICRSPLTEGVFRAVVAERGEDARYVIDSAGTGGWHAGSAPDPRSIKVAAQHGVDISGQICRQVTDRDFSQFELILAMDKSNLDDLRARAAPESRSRIHLFLDYAHDEPGEVPGAARPPR